jgi:hypothetical protein
MENDLARDRGKDVYSRDKKGLIWKFGWDSGNNTARSNQPDRNRPRLGKCRYVGW